MTAQPDPEELTMFVIGQTPDGGAALTLTSRDTNGQYQQATYHLTPHMADAFLAATNRELHTT